MSGPDRFTSFRINPHDVIAAQLTKAADAWKWSAAGESWGAEEETCHAQIREVAPELYLAEGTLGWQFSAEPWLIHTTVAEAAQAISQLPDSVDAWEAAAFHLDGTEVKKAQPSQPIIIACLPTRAAAMERLGRPGLPAQPHSVVPAIMSTAGALCSSQHDALAARNCLILDLHAQHTRLFGLGSEGLDNLGTVEVGWTSFFTAIQDRLKLKFLGSATRLFYGDSYDFHELGNELILVLQEPIRDFLAEEAERGRRYHSLHCPSFPSDKHFLIEDLSHGLNLIDLNPVATPAFDDAAAKGKLIRDSRLAALAEQARSFAHGGGLWHFGLEQPRPLSGLLTQLQQICDDARKAAETPAPKPAPVETPKAPPAEDAPKAAAKSAPGPKGGTKASPAETRQPAATPRQAAAAAVIDAPRPAPQTKPSAPAKKVAAEKKAAPTPSAAPVPVPAPVAKPAAAAVAPAPQKKKSNLGLMVGIGAVALVALIGGGAMMMSGGGDKPAAPAKADPAPSSPFSAGSAPPPSAPMVPKPQPVAPVTPTATSPSPAPGSLPDPLKPGQPATARLSLVSFPTGAQVSLDGRVRGRTPLNIANVAPGPVEVRVSLSGYAEQVLTLDLKPQEVKDLSLNLEPLVASVRIGANVSGVQILLSSKELDDRLSGAIKREGKAPATFDRLKPGVYEVVYRRAGWPDYRQQVRLDGGSAKDVSWNYVPARLRIQTTPAGASVTFNGIELGKTPLALDNLPAGSQIFAIKPASDFEPEEVSVDLVPGQETRRDLTLRRWDRIVPAAELDQFPEVMENPTVPLPNELALAEGRVVISGVLGLDGRLTSISVVETSDQNLSNYAVQSAQGWLFTPARRKGRPVRTKVSVPILFGSMAASGTPVQVTDVGAEVPR